MTASPPSDSRYHALDGLRAIMMTLGVVLHTAMSYGAIDYGMVWPYKDAATSSVWDAAVVLIHSFRMPLFFVLAGFFAALLRERRGLGGMLRNRALRIALPFALGWVVLSPLVRIAFFVAMVASGKMPTDGGGEKPDLLAALFLPPMTMHLWFLYYLLYFYAAAAILDRLASRLSDEIRGRFRRGFDAVAASVPGRVLVFGAITALTLLPNTVGALESSNSFAPPPKDLLGFFVFFGIGWLFYGARDALLPTFRRLAWTQIVLALLVVLPVCAGAQGAEYASFGVRKWPEHLVASLTGGPLVWMLIFGITGLFLRHFDRPIPALRYLTDASYWVYLMHLPLVVVLAALFAQVPLPALVKAPAVMALAMLILLATYHLLVRSTPIGWLLNGRRYPFRRARAASPAEPPAEPAPVRTKPEPAVG